MDRAPLSTATYELVLLHPGHLLQKKGSALTVFNGHRDELLGSSYLLSPDGALREGPTNEDRRLPAFSSSRSRAPRDMLNPFLVVLNADIAFRRFRRSPLPLCTEYTELIELTVELVEKIYFEPVVKAFNIGFKMRTLARSWKTRMPGDDKTRGVPDGSAARGEEANSDKSVTLNNLARNSRMGRVVEPPGSGVSHEEFLNYQRYLMSGCDYVDEDDNDEEEEEDYRNDL